MTAFPFYRSNSSESSFHNRDSIGSQHGGKEGLSGFYVGGFDWDQPCLCVYLHLYEMCCHASVHVTLLFALDYQRLMHHGYLCSALAADIGQDTAFYRLYVQGNKLDIRPAALRLAV